MKLKMALIFAKDMDRMIAFYRDGVGLKLFEKASDDRSCDGLDPEGNVFQITRP